MFGLRSTDGPGQDLGIRRDSWAAWIACRWVEKWDLCMFSFFMFLL